jgi:restriction endonuclease Mrr
VNVELEIVQVLRTASEEREVEELVKWGIPYDRILWIVREMLQTGHLEEATGGQVVLTDAGRARLQAGLEMLENRRIHQRFVTESAHSETQPVVDYIPPKLVD